MKSLIKPACIVLYFVAGSLLPQSSLSLDDTGSAQEPALGRLFLTPKWRDTLERKRQFDTQPAKYPESDTLRLDGVVARSAGKSTVWINNKPQTESARDTSVQVAVSPRQPARIAISSGMAPPVDMQVGVTLDQASGQKSGGLASGEIRVRPARDN